MTRLFRILETVFRKASTLMRLAAMRFDSKEDQQEMGDFWEISNSVLATKNVYAKPEKLNKKMLRILVVMPPVGKGGGGHRNIFRFFNYLAERGHIVNAAVYERNAKESADVTTRKAKNYYSSDIKFIDVCDTIGENPKFKYDVIFATDWRSAYQVNAINQSAHKMYFVQDFEPFFFAKGSAHALAENTYKFGFHGVCAGGWLPKVISSYRMRSDYYDFGVNLDVYRPSGLTFNKSKKILFYARSYTERRGYELGILALEKFHKFHPEYSIEFLAQEINDNLPFPYVSHPTFTDMNKLAKLYHESEACLVLSFTNCSLLPLELLAAGCIPVVNEGENNSLIVGENNDIVYSEPEPDAIAKKLCEVVECDNKVARATKASDSVQNRSWQKSLEKFEQIILREVTNPEE